VCERLKVPVACRELAELTAAEHGHVHASAALGPAAQLRLLERCDALRRPQRFADLLLACEFDARGRAGRLDDAYPQRARLLQALARVKAVDTAAVAAQQAAKGRSGPQVGEAIRQARLLSLQALQAEAA